MLNAPHQTIRFPVAIKNGPTAQRSALGIEADFKSTMPKPITAPNTANVSPHAMFGMAECSLFGGQMRLDGRTIDQRSALIKTRPDSRPTTTSMLWAIVMSGVRTPAPPDAHCRSLRIQAWNARLRNVHAAPI